MSIFFRNTKFIFYFLVLAIIALLNHGCTTSKLYSKNIDSHTVEIAKLEGKKISIEKIDKNKGMSIHYKMPQEFHGKAYEIFLHNQNIELICENWLSPSIDNKIKLTEANFQKITITKITNSMNEDKKITTKVEYNNTEISNNRIRSLCWNKFLKDLKISKYNVNSNKILIDKQFQVNFIHKHETLSYKNSILTRVSLTPIAVLIDIISLPIALIGTLFLQN